MSECAGYTDSSLKEKCPELPVCEVRLFRDRWHPWHEFCEEHATALVKILGDDGRFETERRELKKKRAAK